MKLDINRKNIAELRSEIDSVKMQNHKCAVQIEDIIRDIHGIRRMCDNREAELATQMSKNQELDAKNQQIAEENKSLLIKVILIVLRLKEAKIKEIGLINSIKDCKEHLMIILMF